MSDLTYKYSRDDFAPLPVQLNHLDILLRFFADRVWGENVLHLTAGRELSQLVLDACELTIVSVELLSAAGEHEALAYDYRRVENKLIVTLPHAFPAGARLTLRTRTECVPSESLLEGIYRDTAPPGAPPQYMSQCQQWGFQRIMPIFDDCTAKCTMTTTLEGDARYTHLISNGDICPVRNPGGNAVPLSGDPTRQTITYINRVPMAPYLFIAAAGTWELLVDEFTYPSGKQVRLEYLVPPGRLAGARVPMHILKESMAWHARTQGYEYPFTTYRTICMEKSNWGGMENVGNTTIVTDAALVDDFTTDARLKYAYAVILHEFEHNECGSEVTMATPFDFWLNEAYTVAIERQFLASQFDPDGVRLAEVEAIRSPMLGPLAVEDTGLRGMIAREGFNHPDELVDGVTYVKAAEVIRMLRLLLGAETFRCGKERYFSRYRGGNASTDDFFACFTEVSGRDLAQFRNEWLHSIGYPQVTVEYVFDEAPDRLTLVVRQARNGEGGPFHLPLAVALVDSQGNDIPGTARVLDIRETETEITFSDLPVRPAFASLNRDYSFYGTLTDRSATPAALAQQVRLDPNPFCRVEALRRLTDRERIRLIDDENAVPGKEWVALMGVLLDDSTIPRGTKAHILRITEQPLDRAYLHRYRERYRARRQLMKAVAAVHMPKLLAAFHEVDTYRRGQSPKDGIDERRLKAVLLGLLNSADTAATHRLAEEHYARAWNITDKVSALACINHSSHPRRHDLLAHARNAWHDNLSGYLSYLRILGGGANGDVFEMLREEEARPEFHLAHPSHSRALFMPLAANNKLLWSGAGLSWLAETVTRLAPINETLAALLLTAVQHVAQLEPDLQLQVVGILTDIQAALSADRYPVLRGRTDSYLAGVRTFTPEKL